MSEEERAIRAAMASWMAASSAGDVAKVLTLMADDVRFLVPGRPPFGKEEFATAARAMRDVRLDGTNEIEELQVLGDWAFCVSRVAVSVTPREGAPFSRSGYTLSLWRRDARGGWVLARDANLMATGAE
jgi:uncharacterized protein (TIGR02246 family)